jgi:hypothetical protein
VYDRPMNEYEGALFDALLALTRAVASGKTSRSDLAAIYRGSAQDEEGLGHSNGAAVLRMLADITEADTYYVPKPSFRVMPGGKTGPKSSN